MSPPAKIVASTSLSTYDLLSLLVSCQLPAGQACEVGAEMLERILLSGWLAESLRELDGGLWQGRQGRKGQVQGEVERKNFLSARSSRRTSSRALRP